MSKVFNMVGGGGGVTASIFVTGLSETDTVTATNGSKTLTGKWTQKQNPDCVVPSGYTQLEYIESTGTQYIDTGIVIGSSHDIDMVVKPVSPTNNTWYAFFGANTSHLTNSYLIGYNGNNQISLQKSTGGYFDASFDVSKKSHISTSGASLIVDGIILGQEPNFASFDTSPVSAYLFKVHSVNGQTVFKDGQFQLYSYKVKQADTTIQFLVPAKRNSDSAIGMYDFVTDTFFENAGTGTFTAGAEVPQTIEGFLISKIKDFGTWTVTATDGVHTKTQDVLVDVITDYEIEMSLSA